MLKITATLTLGNDAELKQINGKNVINFSGAHSEKYNGETKTTWVDCAKWGDQIKVADYLKKGTKVYVEGFPEVRSYQAKDGTTKVIQSIRVSHIELLAWSEKNNEPKQEVKQEQQPISSHDENDLPF